MFDISALKEMLAELQDIAKLAKNKSLMVKRNLWNILEHHGCR
jgi:hypothetical protein